MTRPTARKVQPRTDRPKREVTKKAVEKPVTPVKKRSVSKSKKASPRKSSSSKPAPKPTYRRMVLEAIKDLGGRSFHSAIAISKYILANYPVPDASYKRSVRLAIHTGMDEGLLLQNRDSYRMSAKGSESIKSSRSSRSRTKSSRSSRSSSSRSSSPRSKKTSSVEDAPKKRTTKNSSKSDSVEPSSSSSSPSSSSKSSSKRSRSSSSPSRSSSPRSKKSSSVEDAPKSPKSPKKAKSTSSSSPRSKSKSSRSSASASESAPSAPVKPPGLESDFIWQYEDNGWKNYEVSASNIVEKVYQDYLANRGETDVRAVKSGQWEYLVDFMAMKQTNIRHDNHTIRRIQRVPVSSG